MNPKYTALFALMAATAYASDQAKTEEKPAPVPTRAQFLSEVKLCADMEADDKAAAFKECIAKITFPELRKKALDEGLNLSTYEADFEKIWPAEDKPKAATVTVEKKESTFSWGSTTMIVVYVVAGIAVVGGGAYAVMRGSNKEEL